MIEEDGLAARAPIDGDLAVLLAEASMHLGSGLEGSVDNLRAQWRSDSIWMRGEPAKSLADVAARDDVIAGVPVRWYGPDPDARTDIVVYLHGGGWMLGEVDAYDPDVRLLTRELGCAVVSVDYRRTPEHPFPAAIDDCVAVVRSLALSPRRGLAVAGDSAGGNLALGAAAALAGAVRIDAVLALYPVIDPDAIGNASYRENGQGFLLTADAMELFWNRYTTVTGSTRDPRANLAVAQLDGFPAVVIATADYDPLRDEARQFARRLVDVDVDVTYLPQPGLVHGFQQMVPRIPAAAVAVDAIYAAFATTLARAIARRHATARLVRS
jgi:acetyl esterase